MTWKFPYYTPGQPIPWDQLESNFSWFRDMKGVPQDPIWHAEGDVFIHTKMVVEALVSQPEFQILSEEDKHILFAAALLHDVEKRSTTTTEVMDGVERIVSPRHAKRGEYTVRNLLYQEIETPFKVREQVAKLVRLHGLPLWAITKEDPAKAVIGASLVVDTAHLSLLARADIHGRICQDQEEILLRIDLFDELCRELECFGTARVFATDHARYWYLNKQEAYIDYVPFDEFKCEVTVMCALPGSGKDTYIAQNLDLPMLSLDDIRRKHKIDPTDKKRNGQVIQMGKEEAKVFLRAGTEFVFNATNITREIRSKWISLFIEYGAKVKLIYVEVPYRQLLQQNRARAYPVPEKVVKEMIRKLEIPAMDEAHEVVFQVSN